MVESCSLNGPSLTCFSSFLILLILNDKVAGPIWPTGFTRLCGVNSDQHFYIHINPEAEGETVDLIINTVARNRYKFGFWVTQIDCSVRSNLEAPTGCTQYHLGDQVSALISAMLVQYHNFKA